jgi:copper(I)-binding protein
MKHLLFTLTAALTLSTAAWSQTVSIDAPWARATVPGQKASGAFMQLTAPENMKLVAASSPVAGVTEIHEMKMDGNLMKMSAIPFLALPAGQAVTLKPGGYHVMLLDLKSQLKTEAKLPLTLTFENAKGTRSQVTLEVPIQPLGATQPMKHGHMQH